MNNFLGEIIKLKKRRLAIAKAKISLENLKRKAFAVRENSDSHRLQTVLKQNDKINIIAEIKRASPSKGVINDKIDIGETAQSYERGGACAVSVLTEEDFFKGSLEDLRAVKHSVSLPILRKDFIFEEFQIYESAAIGGDAILLIAAMLDDEVLTKLHRLAERDLGLDVLVEVHTLEELERIKKTGAKIIGINNRDLHSFKVSLDVSRRLIKHAPEDALMISESGLQTLVDLFELKSLGFSGFLIGETLMKSGDVERTLKQFTTEAHRTQR